MRVTTLLYGLGYLAVAGAAYLRCDAQAAGWVIAWGGVLTALHGVMDLCERVDLRTAKAEAKREEESNPCDSRP